MRINVYSQELTDEVLHVEKESNTGIKYVAVQFVLHSSPMLHHPPQDDDRSAVTFWLPQSLRGLVAFESALMKALQLTRAEIAQQRPGITLRTCGNCGRQYAGPTRDFCECA